MKQTLYKALIGAVAAASLVGCSTLSERAIPNDHSRMEYPWMLGPFVKKLDANPCLKPDPSAKFLDPISQEEVHWQALHAYNPAAVVKDGKVFLLFRAEDGIGAEEPSRHRHSRIGLAVSEDGYKFVCLPKPVLYPDNDEFKSVEWDGGCEDPRIFESREGKYFLYYTGYNGRKALLCCAESTDLNHWKKHGPIFQKALNGKYSTLWSKSGAVVCKQEGEHFYAVKISGRYWMYWGDSNIYAATSDDLINWTPVEYSKVLLPVVTPRREEYDGDLCEPGPQAFLTHDGIVLIYNGKGKNPNHDGTFYSGGQILLDPRNPSCVIMRTTKPFIWPTESYDMWRWSKNRKSGNCFLENLVFFKGKYIMYYGAADHEVAIAEWKE